LENPDIGVRSRSPLPELLDRKEDGKTAYETLKEKGLVAREIGEEAKDKR
jgi:hypothetical protein